MAHNQAPAFVLVLVALILFAAVNPLAHAQLMRGINVNGRLCCTTTGSCPGGPGILGVPVSLNCTNFTGSPLTVGRNTTGADGGFNISVHSLLRTLGSVVLRGNIIPCRAVVQLPLNRTACPVLSTATGALAGVPSLVNMVVSRVSGVIGNFTVPLFMNATIGM